MSLNKSATRRLSLLTGSSLIAASLTALGGLALTPTAALAQATCTSPPAPTGNGTTAVTIAAGTYEPGVTCAYTGAASTVTTAGAVTVSTAAGGNGVNLSATGSSVVNWVSSAGTVTGGAQTGGPVIDVTSEAGAINITAAAVTGTQPGTTHAIRATSTGGGAITITKATGVASNVVVGGQAGLEAVTNGGNISITNGTGGFNGRLRGILAQTSGAGAVTINLGAGVSANFSDSVAAIDATSGAGGVAITVNAGTINGGLTGKAIIASSTSTSATSAVNVQNTGGIVSGRVDFSGASAGGVTFNNAGTSLTTGRWTAVGASVFSGQNDTLNLAGLGNNTMASGTSLDFAGGADVFNLSARLEATNTTLNFGAGTDAFNLSGSLFTQGTTVISNLEALNFSGTIYMGQRTAGGAGAPVQLTTDGVADDLVRMASGTWTGSGSARVVLDVDLTTMEQVGCATLTGGADCFDLRGASTDGVTTLTLMDIDPDAIAQLGAYNPVGVTLVDVEGAGTSAAGHFVIDPTTTNYVNDPTYGGAISRPGLFVYTLRYDAENQRHALVGLPRSETMEYAVLSGAAQSIWHMTAQTVTDRQTDLRERPDAGPVWLRSTGEYTRRDVDTELAALGGAETFDNGYKLYAGTIMGGADLISGGNEAYDYAAGLQIGYVASRFDLNGSETSGRFAGATGGAYASLWSDWFFADGTLNINGLTLDYDSPGLGSKTTTFLNSVGLQGEAGLRTRILDNTFVEPLANLSWVRTSFEEISLRGGEVEPADAESLRGAIGMRLGSTLPGESVSATWFVAGRAWYEFEGEYQGGVNNPGADLPFTDEFTGGFGEAEAGVNVFNAADTLSGYLTSGVKWKDGYSAVNLSMGVRMAW